MEKHITLNKRSVIVFVNKQSSVPCLLECKRKG